MSKLNEYLPILEQELRVNQIAVIKWRPSSSGCAHNGTKRTIECPRPTDEDRLHVGFHEIGHVVKGHTSWGKKPQFIEEFECDMFAYALLAKYNITPTQEMLYRTEWHILMQLAKAHNRRLSHAKIPADIQQWIRERGYNINEWIGKKVFVDCDPKFKSKPTITKCPSLPLTEVRALLGRKGLMIEKSESDDSTYGHWIVRSNGERYGAEFYNLPEVIQKYKLA